MRGIARILVRPISGAAAVGNAVKVALAALGRLLAEFLKRLLLGHVDHRAEQTSEMRLHRRTRRCRVPLAQCIHDVCVFGVSVGCIFNCADRRVNLADSGDFGTDLPERFDDVLDGRIARSFRDCQVKLLVGVR